MNYEDKLAQIAREHNATVHIEEDSDGWFKNAAVVDTQNTFYIWFRRYDAQFIPTDLSTQDLPRELYGEPLDGAQQARIRAGEILDNFQAILEKRGTFYPAPKLFNKQRGYIILPLDGEETKILQKHNSFEFPVAE